MNAISDDDAVQEFDQSEACSVEITQANDAVDTTHIRSASNP